MKPINKLDVRFVNSIFPNSKKIKIPSSMGDIIVKLNQLISSHNKLIKIIDKLEEGNNDMP